MGSKSCDQRFMLLALLAVGVDAYPSSLSCSSSITSGTIMGQTVQRLSSTQVQLAKEGTTIACGGTLTPGDTGLTLVKASSGVGSQYVIEAVASAGTGAWGIISGACSMQRLVNSVSNTYTVPQSGNVTLRIAHAAGYGTVSTSADCTYAVEEVWRGDAGWSGLGSLVEVTSGYGVGSGEWGGSGDAVGSGDGGWSAGCQDDPMGYVAADPHKSCSDVDALGGWWQCDSLDPDFNGVQNIYVYELCPRSCGRCGSDEKGPQGPEPCVEGFTGPSCWPCMDGVYGRYDLPSGKKSTCISTLFLILLAPVRACAQNRHSQE